MRVVKIVEEDVSEKVDTLYILEQFRHLDQVGITFICMKDEQEGDDWVDETGAISLFACLTRRLNSWQMPGR